MLRQICAQYDFDVRLKTVLDGLRAYSDRHTVTITLTTIIY